MTTKTKKPQNRRTPRQAFEDGIQEVELAIKRWKNDQGQYKLGNALLRKLGELAAMPDDESLLTPPAEQVELSLGTARRPNE